MWTRPIPPKPARALAGLAALLGLAGCEPASMMMSGAGMATLVATDKTLTDHAISLALDRDCSFVRSSRGESFCAPEPSPSVAAHCYRTLGGVSCYRRPDPAASERARVEDTPAMGPPVDALLPGLNLPDLDLPALDLSGIFGETDLATQN
jgi:hypothetical protein